MYTLLTKNTEWTLPMDYNFQCKFLNINHSYGLKNNIFGPSRR
jgi:hypothetical protein